MTVPTLAEGQQAELSCIAPGLCSGSKPKIEWLWKGRGGGGGGKGESRITGRTAVFSTVTLTAVSQRHSSRLTFKPTADAHHSFRVTCRVSFLDGIRMEETVTVGVTHECWCASSSPVLNSVFQSWLWAVQTCHSHTVRHPLKVSHENSMSRTQFIDKSADRFVLSFFINILQPLLPVCCLQCNICDASLGGITHLHRLFALGGWRNTADVAKKRKKKKISLFSKCGVFQYRGSCTRFNNFTGRLGRK